MPTDPDFTQYIADHYPELADPDTEAAVNLTWLHDFWVRARKCGSEADLQRIVTEDTEALRQENARLQARVIKLLGDQSELCRAMADIGSAAGIPDASEACRVIIRRVVEARKKLGI